MLRVGLTGGIGSGKSEVARLLVERGAYLVDSDVLAREVVAPGTPGLAQVVAEFGDAVLAEDGSLDRQRLADIVFADDAARARLNAIVHPLVATASAAKIAAAPPDAIVVQDVPLLVENSLQSLFDVVVVVAATPETQVERLIGPRGMPEVDARARIAVQLPLEAKVAVADYVIDNNGPRGALITQVDRLWADLIARMGLSRG